MDRFQTRAAIAIAAFVVIGAASVVVSAQQPDAVAPIVTCIDRADRDTLLTDDEIRSLCFGATNEGPPICYVAARDQLFLSNVEAIRLCRCAQSAAPVSCFEEVRDRTGSWIEPTIAMCNEITTRRLRSDCTPINPSATVP